ncbi:hypothetical protein Tco_1121475 [Tanacetum coccineum]|uniref:Uncharacterized protein n=1 Tax=Tanacetum coccineum TaxID=301880 RepID=A0ABQ5IZC1_9ASTR
MDPSLEFKGPVKGLVEGIVEGPVKGLIEDPSSDPKGHNLSTYKRGNDRADQTELVKQDMFKEELVNSHDLLGPGMMTSCVTTFDVAARCLLATIPSPFAISRRLVLRQESDGFEVAGMDKSKITRKQSKTGKHGHENQKSTKPKPEKAKTLAHFSFIKPQGPILQIPKRITSPNPPIGQSPSKKLTWILRKHNGMCPQLDQTATIDAQMIEEMIG